MEKEVRKIAGYLRISVDTEEDRDNTSIENQRRSIEMYVKDKFPKAQLDFYTDRDRSGYTFEQREGYMELRPLLKNGTYDALIVKDISRFSRRNSRGLCELEDLRDCGLRIIAINDGIDFPVQDDWTLIQFKFLMNEMPVTDTSKKVRRIIEMKQKNGDWICNVPYGYIITNTKLGYFEVDPQAAGIVKKIFSLYLEGWGYKKIANYLTDEHIPTPRMLEKERKDAQKIPNKINAKKEWSIITIQTILQNDFYIGTLRQRKYTRSKINGPDKKLAEDENIVFENNHEPIISYRIFATVQEQMKKRTTSHYRGVKKYDTSFSGFLYCGDCGSPMFSMSRKDLAAAYVCGSYHRRGLKGCTSHHTRVDLLTTIIKGYVAKVMENSESMLQQLEQGIADEKKKVNEGRSELSNLQEQLADAKEELRVTMRQRIRDIQRNPAKADLIEETYDTMEVELQEKIAGLEQQIAFTAERENTVIKVNRIARTAIDIFNDILNKDLIDKNDLDIILDKIVVYEDNIEISLKSDIQMLLETGTISKELLPDFAPKEKAANFNLDIESISKATIVLKTPKHKDKALDVNVISSSDPLEIFTAADGEVIFKKYSPIGELSEFADQYAEVLCRATDLPVIITDRDHVISVSGISKKEYLERRISSELEALMESRTNYTASADEEPVYPISGMSREAAVAYPIIGSGDVSGCVVLLLNSDGSLPSETERKLVSVAASFLGKQMEE